MWLFIVGIILLLLSASFGAYLAEFYTPSFNVASFAKATAMTLFFVGIIMLFLSVGWWGVVGIVGYWGVFTLSRVHWHKRFEAHLKAGTDPWHGMLEEKKAGTSEMNEMINQGGKSIFYVLFTLNLAATIGERSFPVFYLDISNYLPEMVVSIIILVFLFYGLYRGYRWLKYTVIILGFSGAVLSINSAWNIYSAKVVFYDGRLMTQDTIMVNIISWIMLLNGLIYSSTALLLLFSKSLKSFLKQKRSSVS